MNKSALFYAAEVRCEDPSSLKDGFIEVSNFKGKYVYGSLATYHCNPGYILWGNASRLCSEDGKWNGVQPQCKPITCGQPPEVKNGHFRLMNGTSTAWKSLVVYSCHLGHRMLLGQSESRWISFLCAHRGKNQLFIQNLMFEKCKFCEKWDFEHVNFVKNGTLKMWILWKMVLWKCEFCQKWDFQNMNFWDKLRIFAPVW